MTSQSAASIQDLSQEVLEIIFDHLDWKDLMSLTLTSTFGNAAVSGSKKFLSTTTIKLNPGNLKEEINHRTFSKIEIDSVNLMVATKKVLQICRNIKKLKLKSITIVNKLDLYNFLKMQVFENLELLELEDIKFCDKTSFVPTNKRLIWNNLKQISFISTDHVQKSNSLSTDCEWILNNIDHKSQLKNLKIHRGRNIRYKNDDLIKFLNKLEALESLDLKFVDFSVTSSVDLKPKFKLDELKVKDMPYSSPKSNQMISSWLKQGKRLTILKNCHRNLVSFLMNVCCETLEYLHFDLSNLPAPIIMKNHDLVKTLILTGELTPAHVVGDGRLFDFVLFFVYATEIQLTYAMLLDIESDMMVKYIFDGKKKLSIDYFFGSLDGDEMPFPSSIEELEIRNFRHKQLQIIRMRFNNLKKVKVWVLNGFTKFGDRIFKALHAVVHTAEVFEIFDGKKVHRKTKGEIEIHEMGRALNRKGRKRISQQWKQLKELDELYEDVDSNIYKNILERRDAAAAAWAENALRTAPFN